MGLVEVKKYIMVFFMAMLPVVELRGAIPIGLAIGLAPMESMVVSILGNILIMPIIMKVFIPTMDWFGKTRIFQSTIGWLKDRTMRKTRNTIKKYSMLGLVFFVAIPIPSTGVWTGSLAASILKMDYRRSILMMSIGVVISGIIVTFFSRNIKYIV